MDEILENGNKREAVIALKMFAMSGCMAFEGLRLLGAEEEPMKSAFMAWLEMGMQMFGKEIFAKTCMEELKLIDKAFVKRAFTFNMNTTVQC